MRGRNTLIILTGRLVAGQNTVTSSVSVIRRRGWWWWGVPLRSRLGQSGPNRVTPLIKLLLISRVIVVIRGRVRFIVIFIVTFLMVHLVMSPVIILVVYLIILRPVIGVNFRTIFRCRRVPTFLIGSGNLMVNMFRVTVLLIQFRTRGH